MARKVIGPTGSRRRRWVFLCTAAVTIALAVLIVPSALAVHDEAFQLDGDVIASTTTNYGGVTQNYDWDSMFTSAGANQSPLPTGFTAAGFKTDYTLKNGGFGNLDNSTYTQGSKDIDNVGQWVCTAANNVTDKGDIINAYATAYTNGDGSQFLYFALERSSNNGDANVGFWFLQDGTVGCDASNGTTNFSGAHQDGDIFIVSAFTKGGDVSTITAYRWNGGANGSLGSTPVAGGGDCRASSQGLDDPICATSNENTITTPWLTDNNGKNTGFGHSLLHGEFFEGGINLTSTHLGDRCFNSFVPDTRSSQSLTATLYDFAVGKLGECTSNTVTTPTPNTSTTIPANAQLTTSDSAHITVSGVPQFSGTVDFYICGPNVGATANCNTGGTLVNTATLTDATSPQDVSSSSVTVTEVGKYCWRAVYSGDTGRGVPGSTDPKNATDQSECFSVTPRTPNLTTCSGTYGGDPLTCTPGGTVNFGSSVSDRANLTNTANEQGTGGIGSDGSILGSTPAGTAGGPAQGTITFKLYGPGSCTTLAAGFPTAGLTATVNGNGQYGPVSFTPAAPGVYHWKASYGGDSPNTNSASETNCSNTDEDVTVRQVTPTLSTRQYVYPQDKTTITCSPTSDCSASGAGALSGNVRFRLYDTLANCTNNPTETTVGNNGLLYISSLLPISGAAPQSASTGGQTSYAVTAGTTVYWRVTYTSSNTAETDAAPSACTEQTTVSFAGNDSSISVP